MAIKGKSHSRKKHGTPAIQVFKRHERIASESKLLDLPLDQPMPDALRVEYCRVTEMLHLGGTEDGKNITLILEEIDQYAHAVLSKSEPPPQKLGWSRYGTAGKAKTIRGDIAHQLLYRVEEAYSLLKDKNFLTLSFRLLLIGQSYMFLKTVPFNSYIKLGIKQKRHCRNICKSGGKATARHNDEEITKALRDYKLRNPNSTLNTAMNNLDLGYADAEKFRRRLTRIFRPQTPAQGYKAL